MSPSLHRLVYYSRNRIAGSPAAMGEEVRRILAASRKNNAAMGVTGALMFNAGCFGQLLEGRRSAVEATFERIQQDERHGEVSVLAFEPIAGRLFAQWSMGFVGAHPEDAAAYADIGAASGFDPSKATGDEILRALTALALEEEAAVSA
jgi:hypothetical protein